MGGTCNTYGGEESVLQTFGAETWEESDTGDNTKLDLNKVAGGGMDWIGLAQDGERWRAFVNADMNLQVP